MTPLVQTLQKVTTLLHSKKIPYMLIGGLANLFWGSGRSTFDIDITIQIQEEKYEIFFRDVAKLFHVRTTNPRSFVAETSVLPLEDKNGIRIDLIVSKLPYEKQAIARAKYAKIEGAKIKVCTPEDLIIHKIISSRFKDREDVRGIISRLEPSLDRSYLDPIIKELAKQLDQSEILSFYRQCFKDI